MRLSYEPPCRASRLLFTLALTVTWCAAPRAARAQESATPDATDTNATSTAPDKREKQVAAILRRLYDIGRRELANAGPDPSDVKAKAAELAHDPDRIFTFVRDEIRYEPYAGVLRGARGALLARAANASDKSLLLVEMLEAGGHKCRLVGANIPADKAAELVDHFLKPAPLAGPLAEMAAADRTAAPAQPPPFVKTVAAETGLDASALAKSIVAGHDRTVKRAAEVWAAVEREAPPLAKRLEAAKVQLGQSLNDWRNELQQRVTHHVWVELARPVASGEAWINLDPSFPRSFRGQAQAVGQPLKLSESDGHRVVVRLLYRRGGRGGAPPEEVELINVPLPAARAAFDGASLAINPADALPPASKVTAMSPEQLVKALSGVQKFQAVLYVGGESYYGKPFDLKGNLFDVTADGRVEGAQKVSGSIGGAFGGALGGGGGDRPKNDAGSFHSLAVTLDLQSPGREWGRQERVLLTAAEATGEHRRSPLLVWDILVQPQPMGAKWGSARSVRHLLDGIAPLVRAADDAVVQGPELDAIAANRPAPFSPLLSGLSLMREAAIARQLKDASNVAALWDAPLVAVAERSFCMNPKAGHACGRARIDIVDNRLAFIPRDGNVATAAAAARAALRQGVFDTAAEALALKESMSSPGAMKEAAVVSPLDDFARARAGGDTLTVFTLDRGAKTGALLGLAEPDRAWVASFERPGHVVVAPSRPAAGGAAQGWWTVDPQTGTVLGRHAGGRGQAMSEKVILTNLIGFAVCMISPTWDATQNPQGAKAGLKIGLAITGCIIGMTFGFAGAGASPLIAENLGLIWAILSGVFAFGDKLLG